MTFNSTQRFAKTVSNYIKFRPGYPSALLPFMESELDFTAKSILGDIGSGTGLLSELFLKNKNTLYGVEPNTPMREAAEQLLDQYPNFRSVDGTAEKTSLSDHSLDFILAGQAFHWFNIPESRKEFLRILKPGGYVLLIWNKRVDTASDLMKSYNSFIEDYSTDYEKVNLRFVNHDDFKAFYGNDQYQLKNFYDHFQVFDFEGFKGRYLSCSYALEPTHPDYAKAMTKIKAIFDANAVDGKVQMVYRTEVYYGKLT